MNINLDAAELDLLVEALDSMLFVDGEIAFDPSDPATALRIKLAGTCR